MFSSIETNFLGLLRTTDRIFASPPLGLGLIITISKMLPLLKRVIRRMTTRQRRFIPVLVGPCAKYKIKAPRAK